MNTLFKSLLTLFIFGMQCIPEIAAQKKLAKSKLGKKIMGGVAKATGGMLGGKAKTTRKRGFSIARLQKRMISAKINAKIQKIRFPVDCQR